MRERGIPFKAEMVRAILAGRKTMTRRLYKPRAQDNIDDPLGPLWSLPSPYGVPGDRLWVREAFIVGHEDGHGGWSVLCPSGHTERDGRVFYRATFDEPDPNEHGAMPWRPSIHMPRWTSRLLLEVTDVRVERLQDISAADCEAEGGFSPVSFADAWEAINGKRAPWASNPWVWVISFSRVEAAAKEAAWIGLRIILNGEGGFPEMIGKKLHQPDPSSLAITALPGGTESGRASIALICQLEDGSVVFCENTMGNFIKAAVAFAARYEAEWREAGVDLQVHAHPLPPRGG